MNDKRKKIRVISFVTALIAVLAIYAAAGAVNVKKLKNTILLSRERALATLGVSMNEINDSLDKLSYISTQAMRSSVSEDICRAGSVAKQSLSEIADFDTDSSGIYKFLSQVGEYSLSLSKSPDGAGADGSLGKMREYAAAVSGRLNYLIAEEQTGNLDFEDVKSTLSGEDLHLSLSSELTDTAQTMTDYPTLIYDGPFSDNVSDGVSSAVAAMENVTQQEAKKKAAEFIGSDVNGFALLTESDGDLPCFVFYNGVYTVSVTKQGGTVLYFISDKFAGESRLSNKNGVKKASEFLEKHGYEKMKSSYYSVSDGILTANFAYSDGKTVFYTDLVKVSVALDSGEITSFDATGFIANHKKREIPKSTRYSRGDCAKMLRSDLKVNSVTPAVIPTDGNGEIYTFEYFCTASDGTDVLVYFDPATGSEREVLMLLYGDGGILTK